MSTCSFKPILFFYGLTFLNTKISTKTVKNQKLIKLLKSILITIKIAIVSSVWIILFYYSPEIPDIFEWILQIIQKITWSLMITLLYATSKHHSYTISKLILLIQKNSNEIKLSSPFIKIFLIYITSYLIQSIGDMILYVDSPNSYFTLLQSNVYQFGSVLDTFYIAVICTFESLIYQQYHAYNQWLLKQISKKELLRLKLSVIVNLCKQCRLLNRAFRGYMLWKMGYIYISSITALFYTYLHDGAMEHFNTFWIFSMLSEILLIVYYYERRLKEVYNY